MGEHGFLHMARREPAAGTESWALLDTGPSQLGTPRLVHLAALIVLARRATAARVRFRWRILQAFDDAYDGVYPDAIRNLLMSRIGRDPVGMDVTRAAITDPDSATTSDVWLIGGRTLAGELTHTGFSSLLVEDIIEPGARQLAVTIRQRGRTDRDLMLDLPDDATCARILRNPFERSAATPRKSAFKPSLGSGLLWAQNGTKLFMRSGPHSILSYPVPNSPRAPAGNVKLLENRWSVPVAAVGRWGRRTIAAGPANAGTAFWITCIDGKCGGFSGSEYALMEYQEAGDISADSPLFPCLPVKGFNYEALLLLDDKLFGARKGSQDVLGLVDRDVAGIGTCTHGIAYVAKRTTLWFLVSLGHDGQQRTHRQFENVQNVFFGFGGPYASPRWGLVAVDHGDGNWTVAGDLGNETAMTIRVPHDERVVGVIGFAQYETPALVVVMADGRTLAARTRVGIRPLDTAPSPIHHAAVSPAGPEIAYTTTTGEVAVYSIQHKAHVLRVFPQGGDA